MPASYQVDLNTGQNLFVSWDDYLKLGYSQEWFKVRGSAALLEIIHPGDHLNIKAHHGACQVLPLGESRTIYYRVFDCDSEIVFCRSIDRCVQLNPDGTCSVIEGQITYLSQDKFNCYFTLRSAIKNRQIVCHYQPIVEFATGDRIGFEALARWQAGRRFVSPELFLDVLIGSELEHTFVVQQLEQIHIELGKLPGEFVALNLSGPFLRQSFAPDTVSALPWQRGELQIEIPEKSLLDDEIVANLRALRKLGHPLKIDDFPQGENPISKLLLCDGEIDGIKLDACIVRNCDTSAQRRGFIRGTVEAAAGLEIVAEGVETEAEMRTLQELGVKRGQGYLFGMARPLKDWAA